MAEDMLSLVITALNMSDFSLTVKFIVKWTELKSELPIKKKNSL